MISIKPIDIIKELTLKDGADVKYLAKELHKTVTVLKDMTEIHKINPPNKNAFGELHNAVVKVKAEIDALDSLHKEMLSEWLNQGYTLNGLDYPSLSDICDLLKPIEACTKKRPKKLKYMDIIDDDLGKLYVEATGKKLGRSNSSDTGTPSGPLFRYFTNIFKLANVKRSPSTAVQGVVKRSKSRT